MRITAVIIQLTQANQLTLWININQISYYTRQNHPQVACQIKMTTGEQLNIIEGPDEVTQKIVAVMSPV